MPARSPEDKDKKATPKPAKKAQPQAARARAARQEESPIAPDVVDAATSSSQKEAPQALKDGVSRWFAKGRAVISEKGPGFLSSIERTTLTVIDKTSKGITDFENAANAAEAKLGKGLKDIIDRRNKASESSEQKPKAPGPR